VIVILVSDLFEGGNRDKMLRRVAEMTAPGGQAITLPALSDDARPPTTTTTPPRWPPSASSRSRSPWMRSPT
jgi:hypothetical protein